MPFFLLEKLLIKTLLLFFFIYKCLDYIAIIRSIISDCDIIIENSVHESAFKKIYI